MEQLPKVYQDSSSNPILPPPLDEPRRESYEDKCSCCNRKDNPIRDQLDYLVKLAICDSHKDCPYKSTNRVYLSLGLLPKASFH
jgi:hypothetical protein